MADPFTAALVASGMSSSMAAGAGALGTAGAFSGMAGAAAGAGALGAGAAGAGALGTAAGFSGMAGAGAGIGTLGAQGAGVLGTAGGFSGMGAAAAAPSMFAMPSLVGPASIASSVMSAFQQRNAGISQDYALKQQAAQEGIKAREEGIIRREKLLNALALQGARTGASGITGMTPKSIALTDIQNFQDEQDMADLGSKLSQNNSRRAGSNARATSKLGAGISLIDNYINYDKVR